MKKTKYLALGAASAALCVLYVGILLRESPQTASEAERAVREALAETYRPAAPAVPAEGAGPEEIAYISPVDFVELQAVNPEIYAWLYIPGTQISYPLVQHAGDDSYYLTRDSEGNASSAGAIFTEQTYSSTDLTEPVTVVYGHRMKSGAMFGQLQALYSDPDGLDSHSEIVVFLPERELHYTVFAAVPYDDRHILCTYDFSDSQMYGAFLDSVYSVREIGAVFREDAAASTDDRLLILSTCLNGNSKRRYLVLAKGVESIP